MIRHLTISLALLLLFPLFLAAQGSPDDYSHGKRDHEIDSTILKTDALKDPVALSPMPEAAADGKGVTRIVSIGAGAARRESEKAYVGFSTATASYSMVEGVASTASTLTTMAAPAPAISKSFDGVSSEKGSPDKIVEGKAGSEESVDDLSEDEASPEALPQFGQLTAGEWNDLSEWNFWNSVNASKDWKHMKDYWGLGNGQRISIRVDNGHEPICDAVAQLFDKNGKLLWTAHSDNFGRAELFTGLKQSEGEAPYSIVVNSAGKETRMGGIDPSREQSPSEGPLVVRVGGEVPKRKVVDLMFMVDATGSMGDELNYVKAELQNVIDRVRSEMGEAYEIRLSTNVYRDHGDEYVVRSQEFSTDIDKAAEFLQDQIANGGGDTPEAVVDALSDAVREHKWSGSAQSRFLFIVLDAPPHYSEEELAEIRKLTSEASAKGIKIIGVSGSGVDKETEFLMRELGIHTGGTYVFLTDNSGIGDSHIEPTVGSYAVEYLNDLLVRLIVQYTERPESLDAITPRKPSIE